MSLDLKIIKNYSSTLYSIASKQKVEQEVFKQISTFHQLFLGSKSLQESLCSKILDGKVKKNIIDTITSQYKFTNVVSNFLHVLVKNSRFSLFVEIVEDFTKIIKEVNNIKHAEVVSAKKLGKKELALISGFLKKELDKEVELDTKIDTSLLGGVVIKYDCNLIDCSISGAIERIKKVAVGSKI